MNIEYYGWVLSSCGRITGQAVGHAKSSKKAKKANSKWCQIIDSSMTTSFMYSVSSMDPLENSSKMSQQHCHKWVRIHWLRLIPEILLLMYSRDDQSWCQSLLRNLCVSIKWILSHVRKRGSLDHMEECDDKNLFSRKFLPDDAMNDWGILYCEYRLDKSWGHFIQLSKAL